MKRVVICVIGFFLMTTTAFAGHPLVTDDAGTAGRCKGQIEIGVSFFYDKDKINELTTLKTEGSEAAAAFTVGLLENLDIVLSVPYLWFSVDDNATRIQRADGISDITFDVKWRFFEKEGWALALKPGLLLPSGNADKGLGAGRTGYHVFLIGTKELDPVAFHVNLGYIRNENNTDERLDIWHASLAAQLEVIKNLKLMANVGIERNPQADSENDPAFLLCGISYDISERITVDAGAKYGVEALDYLFAAGAHAG